MAPGRSNCPDCAVLEGKCAKHRLVPGRKNCPDCAALNHQRNLDIPATADGDDDDKAAMDIDSITQPNNHLQLGVDIPLRYPLPSKPPTPIDRMNQKRASAFRKPAFAFLQAPTREAIQLYRLGLPNSSTHMPKPTDPSNDTHSTISFKDDASKHEVLLSRPTQNLPF